jgi:dihydrofolate reductase
MNFIVAVDEEWNIGNNGGLLVRIPEDMKQFKAKTVNRVVVMGRKTLVSFPGGKPLPDRINIVLTRQKDFLMQGVEVCGSYTDLFNMLKKYNDDDVFIIGGGEIYNNLIPYCEKGYITKIHKVYPADTRIMDLDKEENWSIIKKEGPYTYKDSISYSFLQYKNNQVKPLP